MPFFVIPGQTLFSGIFYVNTTVRFADLTDGTSQTALFSERLMADGSNGLVSPVEDVFFHPGNPATADEAHNLCLGLDTTNLANQFPLFMGAPWMHHQHRYQHISPPNGRSCGFFTVGKATMPASSRHPGGVNVALADGSVTFIPSTVDLLTWRAIGTRNGGESFPVARIKGMFMFRGSYIFSLGPTLVCLLLSLGCSPYPKVAPKVDQEKALQVLHIKR